MIREGEPSISKVVQTLSFSISDLTFYRSHLTHNITTCLAFDQTDVHEQSKAGGTDKYQMSDRISILWAKHSLVSLIVVPFLGLCEDFILGSNVCRCPCIGRRCTVEETGIEDQWSGLDVAINITS